MFGMFLYTLSKEDLEEILSRKTMLHNTIYFYKYKDDCEDDVHTELEIESEQIYYEYVLNLAKPRPMLKANNTVTWTRNGYFYIHIKDDLRYSRIKVNVTLQSTNDLAYQQDVRFSSVVDSPSNPHDITLLTASSKTQLASQTGVRRYYEILVLRFKYLKPAHYIADDYWFYSKRDGYRMNFEEYTLDNDGSSTVNNTGHNRSDRYEEIDMQVNVMNAGMLEDNDGISYFATRCYKSCKGIWWIIS